MRDLYLNRERPFTGAPIEYNSVTNTQPFIGISQKLNKPDENVQIKIKAGQFHMRKPGHEKI